jgi:hypothetical protein
MAAGFGYDVGRHQQAWEVLSDLEPDVGLVQEVVPPRWVTDEWAMVFRPKFSTWPWGCAVIARDRTLTEFVPGASQPWLGELGGAAVVASVGADAALWLASIHSGAYAVSSEPLSRLTVEGIRRCHPSKTWEIEMIAHELEQTFRDRRFIAGGDLNSALLFDAVNRYDYNARLFDNLRQLGFHDLRDSQDEQPTFFKEGRRPYQLDHVYADHETASSPHSCKVVPEPATDLGVSDHAPIVIDFEAST